MGSLIFYKQLLSEPIIFAIEPFWTAISIAYYDAYNSNETSSCVDCVLTIRCLRNYVTYNRETQCYL